jgi:hypothetical protein
LVGSQLSSIDPGQQGMTPILGDAYSLPCDFGRTLPQTWVHIAIVLLWLTCLHQNQIRVLRYTISFPLHEQPVR